MIRYGVKLKSGKVVWVLADTIELRDGVILFLREGESTAVAGFNLDVVDHFGRPDAFATDSSASPAPGTPASG